MRITPLYSELENIVGESASARNEPLFLPVVYLKLYIEHLVGFIQGDIARNASQLEGDFGVQFAHNWVDERHAKADAAAAASRMVDYMSDGPGKGRDHIKAQHDELRRYMCGCKHQVGAAICANSRRYLNRIERCPAAYQQEQIRRAADSTFSHQQAVGHSGNIKLADQNLKIARDTRVDSLAMKALAVVTVVFLPPSLIAVRVAHDPACNYFRDEILYHELTSTSADDIQYVNVRLAGLGFTSDDSQLLDLLDRLHTTGNPLGGPVALVVEMAEE
ncbi:hypothetical protein LTR70_008833 [Exophiala xenobiotica]|uniref:Uncharacterized protein n=1 Tax=Lithohypha guttulata TaxID=1690604 RepID=A0ABR0JZX8_9EURO|nr:hypothetical protein LTR24_008507 [Lithohypha guttulata]KAK5311359.1 hypothetical protein LTR70_008833 [Exophiala xenobiotica]